MTSRLFASAPKVTQREPDRLKAPTRCQLCDEDAQVVMLAVREGSRQRVNAPSTFTDKGVLRPEFVFLGWIARCGDHYLRDIYRAKRGRWNGINDDGTPGYDDYRRLHGDGPGVRGEANRAEPRQQARDLADDQDDDAGLGGADDGASPDRPARHLSRDALAACVGWEVYRDHAGPDSRVAAER